MIKVTWSNDLGSLAADLSAALTRQQAPAPQQVLARRHCVVVQNRLMEQWFKHSVLYNPHDHSPVLANIDFCLLHIFVNDWLYRMDHRDERRDPGDHPFALNSLLWRVYAELNHPQTLNDKTFGPVRAYLDAGGDDAASKARRRFVLARQVSSMLDRYLLYRPEMMRAWERGGNDGASGADVGWQPVLWRALVSEGRQSQTYLSAFCRMADELGHCGVEKRFHAVHVFGVSMMPRLYLNFFDRLSDLVDTRFYLLNPSGEDWDSCMTPREELAYAQRRLRMENLPDLEPLLGYTNPLLASMGRGCRDFLGEVIDLTEGNTDGDFFVRDQETVLARIQNSLLENALPDVKPIRGDKSLQLHICHSPMRELEALRDFLLSCFDENPALQPREVQVLVPDIMTYAPLIDAVFAPQAANDPAWIPYMIADAMTSGETVLHEAFRRILRLADSRFSAPEVIELLQCENIRKAFQISESDLDTMYALVGSAGIRWGRSAHHRDEALKMKDLSGQTTWRHGLDRLFLGYALAGDVDPGEGIPLPCDRVEGDDARVLGELAHFVSALEEEADFARGSHLPGEWADHIESTVSRFFISTDETYNEVSALHRAVRRLRQSLEASGIQDRLPVGVVREFLESEWSDPRRGEDRPGE